LTPIAQIYADKGTATTAYTDDTDFMKENADGNEVFVSHWSRAFIGVNPG
jgi:hypothetical protein